jgi:hypothetical protein
VKTEDELLDLIAKTHTHGDLRYVKDDVAEDVIYHNQGIELPVTGKENVCAKIQHWFEYHKMFSVCVEAVRHTAGEEITGYVSLAEDYGDITSCIVIESENGLITVIYEVNPENTGRRLFQALKKKFFEPSIGKATEIYNK